MGSLFEKSLEAGTTRRSYLEAVQHFAPDLGARAAAPPLHSAVSLLLEGFSSSGVPLPVEPKRPGTCYSNAANR